MNTLRAIGLSTLSAALCAGLAHAGEVRVEEGQTNVALDFALIEAAANLSLAGVSGDVIAPGTLEGSVAFPINAPLPTPRGVLPTTFTYDSNDFLGTFAGTIEHTGTVEFATVPDGAPVVVGDFTIGFDAERIDEATGASGFFVASTTGVEAVLFDLAPTSLFASRLEANVGADVLISPEFAGLLLDLGLAAADLTGADVGDALVEASTGCSGVDFNEDGPVDISDVIWYVVAVETGNPEADLTGDGIFDLTDLQRFVSHFNDCHD